MSEDLEPQQVIVTGDPIDVGNGKTVFGAVNSPTPLWATWMFRAIFILTTSLTVWIAGTSLIDIGVKNELMLLLKIIDPIVFIFSKMFGIVPIDILPEKE